jgi:hypothetical protein
VIRPFVNATKVARIIIDHRPSFIFVDGFNEYAKKVCTQYTTISLEL